MADLRITVYGGAPGEIGGNRILLEWDDGAWLLDFGTRFGASSRYFEEFVKPRVATLGLRDYLRMGLLPPLECLYRDDLWCHEPDIWERYRGRPDCRRVEKVRGVLLSHAHMDHNGCLGCRGSSRRRCAGELILPLAAAFQDVHLGVLLTLLMIAAPAFEQAPACHCR